MMTHWIPLIALAIASPAIAAPMDAIPEHEPEFVTAVQSLNRSQIVELLGDPAYQYDIKDNEGEVIGSIWHYHQVTTGDDGQYYKTTELDFVGNRVVTVVLINTEDTDSGDDAEPTSMPSNTGHSANTF